MTSTLGIRAQQVRFILIVPYCPGRWLRPHRELRFRTTSISQPQLRVTKITRKPQRHFQSSGQLPSRLGSRWIAHATVDKNRNWWVKLIDKVSLILHARNALPTHHWSRQETPSGPNLPPPNRSRSLLERWPNIITNTSGWVGIAKPLIITGAASLLQWLVRSGPVKLFSSFVSRIASKRKLRLILSRGPSLSSLIRKPCLPSPNASRLHQLAYVVLRSIAVYTYQIACQHIRAYRIDEKAYSLVGRQPPRDFATRITTRSFESANL